MAAVYLHVYDLDRVTAAINNVAKPLIGSGVYHVGVEVYGYEWFFGQTIGTGSGLCCHEPKMHGGHSFRETLSMGDTHMTEDEVYGLLAELRDEWPGYSYDLLRRNCISFADEFVQKLGVSRVPFWIKTAQRGAAAIADGLNNTSEAFSVISSSFKGMVGNIIKGSVAVSRPPSAPAVPVPRPIPILYRRVVPLVPLVRPEEASTADTSRQSTPRIPPVTGSGAGASSDFDLSEWSSPIPTHTTTSGLSNVRGAGGHYFLSPVAVRRSVHGKDVASKLRGSSVNEENDLFMCPIKASNASAGGRRIMINVDQLDKADVISALDEARKAVSEEYAERPDGDVESPSESESSGRGLVPATALRH